MNEKLATLLAVLAVLAVVAIWGACGVVLAHFILKVW